MPLHLDGPPDAPLRPAVPLPGRPPPVLAPGSVRFSVAYGANACPARLMDKGLTGRGALLLPARLRGWVPAFEARRTGYGAVPLTLVPAAGATTDTWVLGLPSELVPRLDRSEGRVPGPDPQPADHPLGSTADRVAPPGTYRLGRVGDVEVAGRFLLRDALAYLPGPATRVQVLDGGWRTWPEHDQAAAAAHVERGGPARPAPPVGTIVEGSWPPTPLAPLP